MSSPPFTEEESAAAREFYIIIDKLLKDYEAAVLNPDVNRRPFRVVSSSVDKFTPIHTAQYYGGEMQAKFGLSRGIFGQWANSNEVTLWSTRPNGHDSSPYETMEELEEAYKNLIPFFEHVFKDRYEEDNVENHTIKFRRELHNKKHVVYCSKTITKLEWGSEDVLELPNMSLYFEMTISDRLLEQKMAGN